MDGGVKFIFKTLLKVPIIIMVSFAVFNVFAFALSYFKILGISYVAMQTAVENNYIPETEWGTITNYLDSTVATYMLENPTLTCTTAQGTNMGIFNSENRVQYGSEVTVTVAAHYRFVWPLTPRDQTTARNDNDADAVNGFDGTEGSAQLSQSQLEQARAEYEENPDNNIVITYTVPGLKYYPDLS